MFAGAPTKNQPLRVELDVFAAQLPPINHLRVESSCFRVPLADQGGQARAFAWYVDVSVGNAYAGQFDSIRDKATGKPEHPAKK